MTVARGEIRIRTGAADPRARCGTQADAAIVDRVIGRVHLIFYVSDQAAATAFWQAVLDCPPALDVPGMTEFALGAHVVLGLMPEAGIGPCSVRRCLILLPRTASRVPSCTWWWTTRLLTTPGRRRRARLSCLR